MNATPRTPTKIDFLLNERLVSTGVPGGWCLLDLLRREEGLAGTKEGCKEGDCGACVVLIGELRGDRVEYRPVTSCLVPVAELQGRHVVTIEGLDLGRASTVQSFIRDEGASQCGFCTPGIVVSLTGQLLQDEPDLGRAGIRRALSGHLCRCTGYRSLKAAATQAFERLAASTGVEGMVEAGEIPEWFRDVPSRLVELARTREERENPDAAPRTVVAGGTDLFVQRGEELADTDVEALMAGSGDRGVELVEGPAGREIAIGARTCFEDLLSDPLLVESLPRWSKYLELMGSWQIRNRATIGGNLVNASPIGDGTILLLALGGVLILRRGDETRRVPMEHFYRGYKDLDLRPGEILAEIRIPDVDAQDRFDYEKISKRRWLDIASVCSAIRLRVDDAGRVVEARIAVGGVAPVPLFLERTSELWKGRRIDDETLRLLVREAQSEISPISDVRGSERAKRLWVRQLLVAHCARLAPAALPGWEPWDASAQDCMAGRGRTL